ncbi:Heparinase II/III N-terminus [Arthrobacter sp. ok362]|nr:Heparinase II/III N-terminus [Arthrobacter sp. ok362]
MLTLPPHAAQRVGPDFSWSADPLDDANWRFQYHTLLWLDNLREYSSEIDSELGIALYERVLKDWIEKNSVDTPESDYAWFDMAVGVRAIVLIQALTVFGPADWLVNSLVVHGEHLADAANYEGKGNHSLHQDMGLIVVAQFLERNDWLELATQRILSMFKQAIDDQGVSREGSIDYQYRNYRWYEEAARRLKAAGVALPVAIESVLDRMPTFMAHATSPSTHYALIGDTLLHRAPIVSGTPTEWVKNKSNAPEERVALYEAGYLFARSSWDTWHETPATSYLTLRFGPGRSTAVHGHEDAGSITFDAHGERLLCDSGLYAYEAGAERLFFRGRSSHNVVDVPGRAYYPSAESPMIAHRISEDHVMATVQVRGLKGIVWHRTLLHSLKRGYILVDDRISGAEDSPTLQRWQLPPGAVTEANPAAGTCSVRTDRGNTMLFTALGNNPRVNLAYGQTEPMSGWRSDDYRNMYETPEITFELRGPSVRFSTLIQTTSSTDLNWIVCSAVERTSKLLRLSMAGHGWAEDVSLSSEGYTVTPTSSIQTA